ncbi:MAG: hypothetical protein LBG80_15095 [Bacteroidales bacterium]|jgi:hypothetical protein|nr:hypothetical protein [Bacteroidales bacterium]
MLEKEFHYYLDNQEEMVKKYDGRFLVIIGEEVVEDYDTYDDAFFQSLKKYDIGTFLIQKCSPGDKDYTQWFYSPRVKFYTPCVSFHDY